MRRKIYELTYFLGVFHNTWTFFANSQQEANEKGKKVCKERGWDFANVQLSLDASNYFPLQISPHPIVTQPETNLPISGLGGYDQVLRDEFEDGKK
jgi:hypothetical protein